MQRYTDVFDRLVAIARAERVATYDEIAQTAGASLGNFNRIKIERVLCEISCNENANGRPLLSAVAVLPEIGYPGKGFFLLARELGINQCCDERSFFHHELKRVHEYWKHSIADYGLTIPASISLRQGVYSIR